MRQVRSLVLFFLAGVALASCKSRNATPEGPKPPATASSSPAGVAPSSKSPEATGRGESPGEPTSTAKATDSGDSADEHNEQDSSPEAHPAPSPAARQHGAGEYSCTQTIPGEITGVIDYNLMLEWDPEQGYSATFTCEGYQCTGDEVEIGVVRKKGERIELFISDKPRSGDQPDFILTRSNDGSYQLSCGGE